MREIVARATIVVIALFAMFTFLVLQANLVQAFLIARKSP
jgi:hypothetical protein